MLKALIHILAGIGLNAALLPGLVFAFDRTDWVQIEDFVLVSAITSVAVLYNRDKTAAVISLLLNLGVGFYYGADYICALIGKCQ